MNDPRLTDGEEGTLGGPRRTDGGFDESDGLLDWLSRRPGGETAVGGPPTGAGSSEYDARVESTAAGNEDVPGIVTWHELLAQGR